MTTIAYISPKELKEKDLYQDLILDVRTYKEYAERHLKAEHAFMPVDTANPEELMLKRGIIKDTTIYFLCVSGNRAKRAAEKFAQAGFRNLFVIEGGIGACEKAGFEITGSANKAQTNNMAGLSLDRQVYITVGIVVTLSVLLGNLFNCVFNYFAFLIGAGLIFAGLTNRCGLAFLLSKAPWNNQAVNNTSAGGACSGGAVSNNTPPPAKDDKQSCK